MQTIRISNSTNKTITSMTNIIFATRNQMTFTITLCLGDTNTNRAQTLKKTAFEALNEKSISFKLFF